MPLIQAYSQRTQKRTLPLHHVAASLVSLHPPSELLRECSFWLLLLSYCTAITALAIIRKRGTKTGDRVQTVNYWISSGLLDAAIKLVPDLNIVCHSAAGVVARTCLFAGGLLYPISLCLFANYLIQVCPTFFNRGMNFRNCILQQ